MEKRGSIAIENLDKYYGENHVIKQVSLDIKAGEFISFLGPSGCGKTTILRMIAGFETLDGGDIKIDGESVIHLPPHKRHLNTVFQHYALFPHLNVFENVAYGLRAKKMKKEEIKKLVSEALELVQLSGFEKRMPNQMSGGQKQRVSIARAIVNKPPVLLLDEPLTALDMKLRKEMRYELRRIQQELGITFIYVTHDQEEAMVMSDKIAVLSNGVIEQFGQPNEIYLKPTTAFVSDFIGETNTFDAMIQESVSKDCLLVTCESGHFMVQGSSYKPKEYVNVSIRPHKMLWSTSPVEHFNLVGTVKDTIFTGSFETVIVELINGREIKISRLAGEGLPKPEQRIYLYWKPEDAVLLYNPNGSLHEIIEEMDLGSWIKQ